MDQAGEGILVEYSKLQEQEGSLTPWTLVVVVVEENERRDREILRVPGVGGENRKYLCESL